jgi:uncharacterized phage protein gp47/JayE
MPIFKSVDNIFDDIKTYINSVIPTFLFKVGNVVHTLSMAFSLAIEDLHVEGEDILANVHLSTAFDSGLDLIGADFAIPRVEATKSRRVFRFEKNTPASQPFSIPSGKRVGTTVDVFGQRRAFTVMVTDSLAVGNTYVDVLCEAEEAGTDSNIPPGSLVEIIDSIPGIDKLSVVSGTGEQDAVDREEDDDYRQRIVDNFKNNAQGTIAALETVARGVPGILDVIITESGANDGIVTAFATDGLSLSPAAAELLRLALEESAAAGIEIAVVALTSIDVQVSVEVVIPAGLNNDEKLAIANSVTQNIDAYVSSLARGEDDLIYNKILAACANGLSVEDVNTLAVNGGATNIPANPTSVFRVITAPAITFQEV